MKKLKKLECDIAIKKHELKQEKRRLHKEFKAEHKLTFRIMDLMMACIIIFNFGALTITDYLVADKNFETAKEENITITFYEANPVTENIHGYEGAPVEEKTKAAGLIFALFKQSLLWAIMILCYIYYRNRIHTQTELYIILFVLLFYIISLGTDFFNNLTLLLAKLRYGI